MIGVQLLPWSIKKKCNVKTCRRHTRVITERLTVHEKPVSSQHPDEYQHNREGEGQELSQSETPTAAKGNPAVSNETLDVKHADIYRLICYLYVVFAYLTTTGTTTLHVGVVFG